MLPILAAVVLLPALKLAPMEGPPVLNSPVYSLATRNDDGSTNMQILTYATPAGVSPRMWAISLYKPTQTYANFAAQRTGILQQLCRPTHHSSTRWVGVAARTWTRPPPAKRLAFRGLMPPQAQAETRRPPRSRRSCRAAQPTFASSRSATWLTLASTLSLSAVWKRCSRTKERAAAREPRRL